jgi:hypothetical protein
MNIYVIIGIITLIIAAIVITLRLSNNKQSPDIPKVPKYSCKNGKCILDPNGKYIENTCNNECGSIPPSSPTLDQFTTMALTASPGTGIIDSFPYTTTDVNIDWNEQGGHTWPSTKSSNSVFSTDNIYKNLIMASFQNRNIVPCNDKERSQFLSYLLGVYYAINQDNLQKLTTDELRAFYRSLVFYYITTQDKQPDGGWYGSYWSKRILDDGPYHNKNTGQTNMSVYKNESFFFDSIMTTQLPLTCNGYKLDSKTKKCPPHSKFFGNRVFAEMCQGSLRRGMRNSPQVLAENPPWAKDGKINSRYGTGGFPADVFVECLQFPQEHSEGGWSAGCDATTAKCALQENFPEPLFQPVGKSRQNGKDPFCGLKSQWFYFSQGNGQFWNLGQTSYCYNYIDMFLNSPLGIGPNMSKNGKANPVGWVSGFGSCTDKLPFPPGPGVLGYDFHDPTKPTEHDYNDPAYSMKLILEYESRVDIPGSCKSQTCQRGLRDPRTGMIGLSFCSPPNKHTNLGCPCNNKTGAEFVKCLNVPEPKNIPENATLDTIGGCGPSQPVNSRMDALNEQVAALMGLNRGTYWKPYAVKGTNVKNLNKAKGIDGGSLNSYGGFNPTDTWSKVRVKNCPLSNYPVRSSSDFNKTLKDKRQMIVGWVNGHFYGYPKGSNIGSYTTPNPYPEGIPGTDLKGNVIYGKQNTQQDPLVYYDMNGKALYTTWYGKPIKMDEETALILTAEFYSCGDAGFENFNTNWPFGAYFGYGQSLGGPGKSAAGTLSCSPYGCTTVQFTSTATAYGGLVQPAYDFEIMYLPPVNSTSDPAECTCATAVTLDLTADFDTPNAGQDLKRYLCLNKGATGGFVPRTSPAGKSAVAFQGQNMKVTNWTTVNSNTGTFDPSKPNKYKVRSDPPQLPYCKF